MSEANSITAMRLALIDALRKEGAALQKAAELSKANGAPEEVAAAMQEAERLLCERTRLTVMVRDLEWKLQER